MLFPRMTVLTSRASVSLGSRELSTQSQSRGSEAGMGPVSETGGSVAFFLRGELKKHFVNGLLFHDQELSRN